MHELAFPAEPNSSDPAESFAYWLFRRRGGRSLTLIGAQSPKSNPKYFQSGQPPSLERRQRYPLRSAVGRNLGD
jgi:hypothetical protein